MMTDYTCSCWPCDCLLTCKLKQLCHLAAWTCQWQPPSFLIMWLMSASKWKIFPVTKRPNGWNAEARFFTVATKPWENKGFLYYYLFECLEPEIEEHQRDTFHFTREAFLALGLSCVALKKKRRFLNVVHPVLLATQHTSPLKQTATRGLYHNLSDLSGSTNPNNETQDN